MLILSLAPHADARTVEWAFARMEGGQLVHQGRASAAQLAQENQLAMAIVPAQRLSWHEVTLPPTAMAHAYLASSKVCSRIVC